MNALNFPARGNQPNIMSSIDLVKLINDIRKQENPSASELRHDHFMAKVIKVLGEEAAPKFRGSYKAADNTERPCYYLPKRESSLMVMSESYKVQAAVYDRMDELERQSAAPVFNPATLSRLQLLQLAMQAEEELQAATQTINILAPKAAALDLLQTGSEGSMCLTDAAKHLGKQPKAFIAELSASRWIYKRVGSSHWVGYQDKIQAGYIEHKTKTIHLDNGDDKITEQVRITAKGLAKLAKKYAMVGEAA